MEKKDRLLLRLQEIAQSVQDTEKALALLGLGSVGVEMERLDEFSDLDFFVIVKDGYKNHFIDDISWLTNITPVLYKFRNTNDGYKIMYEDEIYCEFAVFELYELENIPYAEGRIIWRDDDFDKSLCIPKKTGAPTWKPESSEWLIGEIITCIYVGLCRFNRGEKLSGYRFIQGHAFALFVDLVDMTEKKSENIKDDIYSKERRFEEKFPGIDETLCSFLLGYKQTKEAAKNMINYMDEKYEVNSSMKKIILDLCD